MSVNDIFAQIYHWLSVNQLGLGVSAITVPLLGTLAAWLGKGGKSDADGRFIASVVMGLALMAFVIEILALYIAHQILHRNLLDAQVVVLLAPIVCLAGTLAGIRWVFPLNELASVRTFVDLGTFFGACVAILWLFSKFRGWGIVFWGSLPELIAIGVFAIALMRRLYSRAFGGGAKTGTAAPASDY